MPKNKPKHEGNSSKTRKGVKPNPKRTPKPGAGRGRPAKGWNPETKKWDNQ